MQNFKRPRKRNVKQTCSWKVRRSQEYSVNTGEKQGKVVSFAGEKGYELYTAEAALNKDKKGI